MWHLSAVVLSSCIDYDDVTKAIDVNVQLILPSDFINDDALSGHEVVLTSNGKSYSATTDENGVARFEQLVPDTYSMAVSWSLSSDEYKSYTGDEQANMGATVSGSTSSILLSENNMTITLSTILSLNRSLVISKIYYAGSKDTYNISYAQGKYMEFYNQSSDTVDIAGYYFGLCETDNTPAYTLGLTPDSIYLKQIFRFPADSPIYVAPGGVVLVANSAIDHTPNSTSEHDLRTADFEAKDVTGNGKHENNPATPALDLIYTAFSGITYMNLVQGGPCAIVLFSASESDVESLPLVYKYGKTSGTMYKQLPISWVLDGVEIMKNKVKGIDTADKRLYETIDAGYTCISNVSGWNGELVMRKVDQVADDGRKILVDTNNSTNDFTVADNVDVNLKEY